MAAPEKLGLHVQHPLLQVFGAQIVHRSLRPSQHADWRTRERRHGSRKTKGALAIKKRLA